MKDHHRPPHLYLDNATYFITVSTLDKHHYFDTDEKKQLILNTLTSALEKYSYNLDAWVILNNHYHIEIKTRLGKDLPRFIQNINGRSSFELNRLDNSQGRKLWYQYWDRCIRDETDYYRHMNYIHQNAVKHGYVKDMSLYRWSSYSEYLKENGEGWIKDCFEKYPIIDFTADGEID